MDIVSRPRGLSKAQLTAWLLSRATPDGECLKSHAKPSDKGYAQVWFEGKVLYVPRLVAELFHGPCPPGKECLHSCGRGHHACIRPEHLRWGTRGENHLDLSRHGTKGYYKLGEHAVRDIRDAYTNGAKNMPQLARQYGVTVKAIHNAIHRRTYAWVE